ncbi:hypothetical protein [Kordia sp. SMS9]|uniref:hypothetical protein n=1 Tax=Kordia sp. SMS9 TaxID=2282170 RepID=UPI000E0D405C|nr:hypothetical protein [Kordia sp. SMS9]
MEKKKRHYCTCCGAKQNETSMYEVNYPLLRRNAWHCGFCIKGTLKNFPVLFNVRKFPTTGFYSNNGIQFPKIEAPRVSAEIDMLENENQLRIE